MQLLFLVIKRIELVDEIMRSLAQAGIRGGTVIDSVGLVFFFFFFVFFYNG